MILSRSRIEATLESGVPENVNGIEILGTFKRLKIDEDVLRDVLFEGTALRRPYPTRHLKRVYEIKMVFRIN